MSHPSRPSPSARPTPTPQPATPNARPAVPEGPDSSSRRHPLAAIKANYAVIYSVEGALLPFLSVLLATQHGLSAYQIGVVLAISSAVTLISPPILTMHADGFGGAERLLGMTLTVSGCALLAFAFAPGYWWVLALFTIYGLAREPSRPLLDGIFFAVRRSDPRVAGTSFHQVRIWGTAGYMVPGLALYFVLGAMHDSMVSIPVLAGALALLSVLVVRRLPHGHGRLPGRAPIRRTAGAAWQVFRRPRIATFVIAMFVLQGAFTAYMSFYPFQATQVVGLDAKWLGPLTTLGVAAELAYMASYGWFVRRMGLRWFVVTGTLVQGARSALLALVPTVATLIGAQLVHGMVIVVTTVAARVLLDREASDAVRYSVQGLFAMLVVGGSKIVGNWAGGLLASHGLALMFWVVAGSALVAAILLGWSVRDEPSSPTREPGGATS